MTKLKTFFRRLFAGSFKRMFGYIGTIHKETGKNRFIMFFDMIWCIFRYSVGYMDYRVFGFANIKGKNRRTFMTMNDNIPSQSVAMTGRIFIYSITNPNSTRRSENTSAEIF